jgi:exosortase A-associated hydrolase 2
MDGDASKGASPFFLPGYAGNLFALYHRPAGPADCRRGVPYVHPFANETNYTRRAADLLARALAGRGWGVLQVDLFGCGDSDGDFRDASWETWVDDLTTAFGWLQERGRSFSIHSCTTFDQPSIASLQPSQASRELCFGAFAMLP